MTRGISGDPLLAGVIIGRNLHGLCGRSNSEDAPSGSAGHFPTCDLDDSAFVVAPTSETAKLAKLGACK
jgi:hypothetical protein